MLGYRQLILLSNCLKDEKMNIHYSTILNPKLSFWADVLQHLIGFYPMIDHLTPMCKTPPPALRMNSDSYHYIQSMASPLSLSLAQLFPKLQSQGTSSSLFPSLRTVDRRCLLIQVSLQLSPPPLPYYLQQPHSSLTWSDCITLPELFSSLLLSLSDI